MTSPLRLRAGHHLYPGPDGQWYLYRPGQEFIRLRVPAGRAAALASVLQGTVPVPDFPDPAGLDELLDRFEAAGMLAPADSARGGASAAGAGSTVAVTGRNPLAAEVARLLSAAGVEVRRGHHPVLEPHLDALVSCAGWLPDSAWRDLDSWTAEQAIGWHMVYAEGDHFYLGPPARGSGSPRYADVRARRLAAASAPEALRAYWAYLEAGGPVPPVVWPGPGVVAVIAGLLVTDVLAMLAGRPVPGADYQVEVHAETLATCRHPVLALPAQCRLDPVR